MKIATSKHLQAFLFHIDFRHPRAPKMVFSAFAHPTSFLPSVHLGTSFRGSGVTVARPVIKNAARVTRSKLESPINVPKKGNFVDEVKFAPCMDEGRNVHLSPEKHGDNYHMDVRGGGWIGSIEVCGVIYKLSQIHLHHPSENHLDGKKFEMEMHLVHTHGKNISVLAIFLEKGSANKQLQKILDSMQDKNPTKISVVRMLNKSIDRLNLITFDGSLTTGEHDGGVSWVVSKIPITASSEQIEQFKEIVEEENARDLQDLKHRVITSYKKDRKTDDDDN